MTTETDRELLELAAKAAGIEYDAEKSKPHPISGAWWGLWLVYHREPTEYDRRYWNTLADDGDAFRLRTALMFDVTQYDEHSIAVTGRSPTRGTPGHFLTVREPLGDDPNAATRRAITRAAAEIGRAMKGQTS